MNSNILYRLLGLSPKKIEPNKFYTGVLIKRPASECKVKDNFPVLTIEGDMGKIVNFYTNFWQPNKSRWLDIKLDSSSYKHVKEENAFTIFIQIKGINKTFPLSHSCYKFVKLDDFFKKFQIRITNRGYAMFHEDFKHEREYVAILRRSRYGVSFLNKIESNFKIIKK